MDLLDIAIVKQLAGGGGGSGTDNYNDLSNLPKINDTTLSGNKTAASLGLQNEINSDNKLSSDLIDDTGATNLFVTEEEKLEWSGKQDEITNANKLDADLVDDEESTNKFVTAQDKETWNAKQNAIDSTHKLSSDLVDDTNHTNKFVTSQEKETWSGKQDALTFDDSPTSGSNNPVKSGGIYTALGNKFDTSNIIQSSSGIPASPTDSTVMSAKNVAENYTPNSSLVEVVDNGAKNVCDLYDVISYRSCSPSRIGNGGLHLECTNAVWTQYFSNLYLEPNTEYVLFTRISNFSGNIGDLKFRVQTIDETANLVQYSPTQEGDHTSTFVTSNNLNLKLCILINDSATARTQSADIWVMICTKSQFGISPEYEPYALGNQVITPAMIQKVDEGAKNIVDTRIAASTIPSGITLNSDGTLTVNGTFSSAVEVSFAMRASALNNYILSGCTGGSNSTYMLMFQYRISGGTVQHITQYSDPVAINLSNITWCCLTFRIEAGKTVNTTIKPMICTQADYNVSKSYQVYRPNWDLVSKYALGGGFVSSGYKSAVANADLNAISGSDFALYNSPSNMPSGTSGYCFVRTAYFDIQAILQELVLLSTGVSYVRTKYGSTWNTWKQTSNT